MSFWPSARKAATTIETAPSHIKTVDRAGVRPKTLRKMRVMAYTPETLMRSPDSTAEIGAGAEGWASGSQAWKGTRAALRPNPRRKKAEAMTRTGPALSSRRAEATAAKSRLPVMPKTTAIAATMKADAATESMRYLKAASSSSWPSPKATRA